MKEGLITKISKILCHENLELHGITSERAVLSAPRRLRRCVMSLAEDISAEESLDNNCQEGKSRESI